MDNLIKTQPARNNHYLSTEGALFYRRHPINLLMPTLTALGLVLALSFLAWVAGPILPVERSEFWVTLYMGIGFLAIWSYWFMQWLFWYFDIWLVNKEKLIDSELIALFLHTRSEVPLRQVQDVGYVSLGWLASLFKCGNVTVQTASKQGLIQLMWIQYPQKAVEEITTLAKQAADELYSAREFTYLPITAKLGEILVGRNLLSQTNLAEALAEQQITKEKLGRILLRKNLITKQDLLSALSAQHHIPQIDLTYTEIDPQVVNCISAAVAQKYHIVPMYKNPNGIVEIATSGLSEELVREVREACGAPISFVLADEEVISALIKKYYSPPSPISS